MKKIEAELELKHSNLDLEIWNQTRARQFPIYLPDPERFLDSRDPELV